VLATSLTHRHIDYFIFEARAHWPSDLRDPKNKFLKTVQAPWAWARRKMMSRGRGARCFVRSLRLSGIVSQFHVLLDHLEPILNVNVPFAVQYRSNRFSYCSFTRLC
jgi:hypothetical protein